jgi:hypothetical protein
MDVMLRYCASWGVTSEDIAKGAYEEVAPYWRLEVDKGVLDLAMRRFSEQRGLPYVAITDFLQTEFLEEALKD